MKSKKTIVIVIAVLIVIAAGSVFAYWNANQAVSVSTKSETAAKVERGSIKLEVSGTGVIEPIDSYDISSLVAGKIISAPFEQGDKVKKDDILYQLDSSDVVANIQKTQNSISQIDLGVRDTQRNLGKTVVYAPADGRLTNFNVKENDTINTVKIGDIVNDNLIIAKVPFGENQISRISVGQPATVYCASLMSSVNGTVSKINTYPSVKANGAVMYTVEISIQGITSLAKDTEVTAEIGGIQGSESGKIDIPDTYSVTSAMAGRVNKIYVSNNEFVSAGQKILELENDTFTSALSKSDLDRKASQISLEALQKQLDNYTIKAPIDGVIINKNKKVNDILNATSLAQPLAVVADTSRLKFKLKVDELDINNVRMGQTVSITSDAVPGKTFNGKVTLIDTKGTITNGVSIYQVEVTIDDIGELKPGMNVNAKIAVSQKDNVLKVPVSAVRSKNGKTYVNVPSEDNNGLKEVPVETGISTRDYVEILKGLNENDKIVIPNVPIINIKSDVPNMSGDKNQSSQTTK